jgi:hypothetical protein
MDMMLLIDVTKFSQKINYVFLVLNRELLAGFKTSVHTAESTIMTVV